MFSRERRLGLLVAIGVLAQLTLAAGSAWGQPLVDCGVGGSIQAALNAGNTNILFTGTCNESVFITRDGTTISGESPATSIITGNLVVIGASRVLLRNLTQDQALGTFGNTFVGIVDGAFARIEGSTIRSPHFGVGILRNSFAFLVGNTITFGPRSGDQAALNIGENSAARMVNNTVEARSSSPAIGGTLSLFRDSSATLRGGNTIRSTGTEAAVQVLFDSTLRQDLASVPVRDVFEGSLALEASHLSYLDVREVQVTGGTRIDLHSLFKVGSLTFGGDPANILITGDITVSRDSAIEFVSASTAVNGNIKCTDTESSISLPPGSLAGINTIDCSGFRQVPARPER